MYRTPNKSRETGSEHRAASSSSPNGNEFVPDSNCSGGGLHSAACQATIFLSEGCYVNMLQSTLSANRYVFQCRARQLETLSPSGRLRARKPMIGFFVGCRRLVHFLVPFLLGKSCFVMTNSYKPPESIISTRNNHGLATLAQRACGLPSNSFGCAFNNEILFLVNYLSRSAKLPKVDREDRVV